MTPVYPTSVAVRFWKKVRKTESCWIWTGCTDEGYGRIRITTTNGNRGIKTHRLAWELTHGKIPDGMEVCHNCPSGDNPSCVNPDHLFLGTHRQNMQDAARKKRMVRGSSHPKTKITEDQVILIRQTPYRWGIYSELARQFGVSPTTINRISKGLARNS